MEIEIDIETGAAVLTVRSKKHGTFIVLVDREDWERVSQRTWSVQKLKNCIYFQTMVRKVDGKWTALQLHRFLMNAPKGYDVDHAHHDYLELSEESTPRLHSRGELMQPTQAR